MKSQFIKLVLVLIPIFTLLVPLETYSQEKPMWYGVKGGWNFAFNNIDAANANVQGKSGFVGGGVFEYRVSDLFAINTNLLYNMKGNEWEGTTSYLWFQETETVTWSFNYLSIPIAAKFAFGGQTKFYLLIGPEFSFLLSAEEVTKGEDDEETIDFKEEEIASSFELAGNFGFGVDIYIKPVILFFEVRGSLSFTDVLQDKPNGTIQFIEEGTVRNLVPSLSVGILF